MRRAWLLLLLLPIAPLLLWAQSKPIEAVVTLPPPCPEKGPCRAPEEWRLAWLSSPKEKRWTLYDVSAEHLRQEEKDRWSGVVTLFVRNGERLVAEGGSVASVSYGCAGKQERPSFVSKSTPENSYKGYWALVTPGEKAPSAATINRYVGKRLKPALIPVALQNALDAWTKPEWASDTTVVDAVLPIEMDGDEYPEYWVTRTYKRATYEEPAKRMYSSWAIFDLSGGAKMLAEEIEDECDCLCRDGGCGCCRWDEVTTVPQAIFDADLDGFSEIILEKHQRGGLYRYELWRFDGKTFYQTNLSYEDGGC
jgi:hypothetical protein